MKRTVTCLCLTAAILSGGCTVNQESDKDEVEYKSFINGLFIGNSAGH